MINIICVENVMDCKKVYKTIINEERILSMKYLKENSTQNNKKEIILFFRFYL